MAERAYDRLHDLEGPGWLWGDWFKDAISQIETKQNDIALDLSCPEIDLSFWGGVGLLVPCLSGVVWTNQVGGTTCVHPRIRGIYVPLAGPRSVIADRLMDGGAPWANCACGVWASNPELAREV